MVSLWVAVDRSDSENGCLRVVPSSHKQPLKVGAMTFVNV